MAAKRKKAVEVKKSNRAKYVSIREVEDGYIVIGCTDGSWIPSSTSKEFHCSDLSDVFKCTEKLFDLNQVKFTNLKLGKSVVTKISD